VRVPRAPGRRLGRRLGRRAGFSIVEIIIALVLVTIGMGAFAQSIAATSLTAETNRRTALASQAARRTLEQLKGTAFDEVFATFNTDTNDDPGGKGTAPGRDFDVAGLDPLPGDADGRVGRILFPVTAGGVGFLREDVNNPALGMPRDLNGDGLIDGLNHSSDYQILPVIVEIEWQGVSSDGRLVFKTFLVGY
jgi:type II secretory pathway pseudopilin PulG